MPVRFCITVRQKYTFKITKIWYIAKLLCHFSNPENLWKAYTLYLLHIKQLKAYDVKL
jgi:hypothetical protein